MLWNRIRPGDETTEGPPILSILEFPLQPDVKLDDDVAAPARALWDATVQYVASVPGCGGIEWGTTAGMDDGLAGRVVCLVRWEGALVVDCSNRCAKVVRGGVPSFSGEGDGETVVDIVSVVFDAGDVATVEQRGTVKER